MQHAFWMKTRLPQPPTAMKTAGLIITLAFMLSATPATPVLAAGFDMCSGGNRAARKVTCLVDGDTGWEHGVKWRLKDVDTPEYAAHAECPEEPARAAQATARMLEMMRGGYEIDWIGQKGGFARDLVHITLGNGRDAGRVLIEEGLAVHWPHVPRVWCNVP